MAARTVRHRCRCRRAARFALAAGTAITTSTFFCKMLTRARTRADRRLEIKNPARAEPTGSCDQRRGEVRMADRVIFVCTLILAGIYFYATEKLPSLEIGDPLGPKAFPRLLGVALVITAVMLLLEMIRAKRRSRRARRHPRSPIDLGVYLVIAGVVVWTYRVFPHLRAPRFHDLHEHLSARAHGVFPSRQVGFELYSAHSGLPSAATSCSRCSGCNSRRAFFPSEERTWTP